MRSVFLENPRHGQNASFKWFKFTCGKADSETGLRENSFLFFKNENLFFAISFTYLRFSISSLILNTRLLPACPVCVLFYAFLTSNSHQYISTRLQDLCNASFSAFHSKQINTMIYNYLYVSDNYDSNPSFYEEQPPVIAGRSGFG